MMRPFLGIWGLFSSHGCVGGWGQGGQGGGGVEGVEGVEGVVVVDLDVDVVGMLGRVSCRDEWDEISWEGCGSGMAT